MTYYSIQFEKGQYFKDVRDKTVIVSDVIIAAFVTTDVQIATVLINILNVFEHFHDLGTAKLYTHY